MKKRSFLFLCLLAYSVSGCSAKKMTYTEFLNKFRQDCPHHYLVRDLSPQKAQQACSCMYAMTAQKWPDMVTFVAAISVLDREPRGETDFVPSAIRMAAPYCTTTHLRQGE